MLYFYSCLLLVEEFKQCFRDFYNPELKKEKKGV